MKFGIFDHMDQGAGPLGAHYESRLRLIEAYYGVDAKQSQAIYVEALSVVLQALTKDTVNFDGVHFRFHDVPIEMAPVQKPHPPLWYGVSKPEGTVWAAQNRVNIVTNTPALK